VGKVGFEAGIRGGALLFVHGAAIKFEQAVRRASQMKVSHILEGLDWCVCG
jgi:esterase/lipase superfamily enzyme